MSQKATAENPVTYSPCSFCLLTLVAILLRAFSACELHRLLTKDEVLRTALGFEQVPHRNTIARRIRTLTDIGEHHVGTFGRKILTALAIANQSVRQRNEQLEV